VGCHSFASLGFNVARQFERTVFFPVQTGQPLPDVLLAILASHSWSLPFSHFHHTFIPEFIVNSSGFKIPFLVGCHSFASLGFLISRDISFGSFSHPQLYYTTIWIY